MNDIYLSHEYGISMFHVLYPVKYLLLSKKIMTSVGRVASPPSSGDNNDKSGGSGESKTDQKLDYRKIPFLTAFFMLMLLGEGGGSLGRILTGNRVGLLENDYKFHVIVTVWCLLNYLLPNFLVQFLFRWLDEAPWGLLLVLPNEFRRGMAQCSLVAYYRKQLEHESWLAPVVLAALGSCLGNFTFSTLRFTVLLNHEERLSEYHEFKHLVQSQRRPVSAFDRISFKVLFPFLSSFVYTVVAYDLGYDSIVVNLPFHMEVSARSLVAVSFVLVAIWPYVSLDKMRAYLFVANSKSVGSSGDRVAAVEPGCSPSRAQITDSGCNGNHNSKTKNE